MTILLRIAIAATCAALAAPAPVLANERPSRLSQPLAPNQNVIIENADITIGEFWDAINAHRAHAEQSGQLETRRSFRAREELREIIANRLHQRAREICTGDRWEALTEAVAAHESDPWTAADTMLDGVPDA